MEVKSAELIERGSSKQRAFGATLSEDAQWLFLVGSVMKRVFQDFEV